LRNRRETAYVDLLCSYAAGIYIAEQCPSLNLQQGFAFTALLLFTCLITLNIGYAKYNVYRFKGYTTCTLYLLIFCIGGWSCLFHNSSIQPVHFAKKKLDVIKVIIEEAPQWKGQQIRFKAAVISGYQQNKRIVCRGRLLITLTAYQNKPKIIGYGDELIIPAIYTAVDGPQNPSEFDFKAWLSWQNIHHQIYIDQQQAILVARHRGHPLIAFALSLRQKQIELLEKLIRDQEAFAVASTLILGYRADLSPETLAAYAKTGTIHALSVSGMHVGIIYIVLMWVLQFLDRWKPSKILKTFLIIGLIWFYALITGFSPSVLRSAIMLSSFILAKTWSRRANSYNILAFSAFILLIYQPFLLFDVGFQLSYLAVFGLLYLQPKIHSLFYFKAGWADKCWQFMAMSLAAQLATFPLSIYYFHQFPVYFLLSNLFILVPATLMMYVGISMLLFRLYFLAPVLEWIINFTNAGLKWIAELPYSTISAIWWTKMELILLFIFLVLFCLALSTIHKKLLIAALGVFLVLSVSLSFHTIVAGKQQKTIVFKLRKKSAIAFLQGHKAILFTDVDPQSKLYQYSIQPCLAQHQVRELRIKILPADLKKIKHLW